MFVASGIAVPISQRETACLDTFRCSANVSCDIPLDFLSPTILSDNFIMKSSFDPVISLQQKVLSNATASTLQFRNMTLHCVFSNLLA